LAGAHPEWVLGYVDEVWWSRLKQPRLHAWSELEPLHVAELVAEKADPDPKALACYGLLRSDLNQVYLRFVTGRPVSAITTEFLAWGCAGLEAEGKKAWLLVWDNASWHISKEVRGWIREHNRRARQGGGVRIIVCQLPTKSPWLNPIEPHWMHGKRAVMEPDRKLTAAELEQRICDYYGFELLPHLSKKVA
jgi:DDE superfamily endonuclease